MHHEQPAVNLRLIVRAGSAFDPVGKAGLASLAATLLDQGTTTRTARQMADAVDSLGAGSDSGAGRDLSYSQIVLMKDGFDVGLGLLADMVRHPSFELAGAQACLTGNFPLRTETPDDIARVAAAYLRPDRLSVVPVGNAAGGISGEGLGPIARYSDRATGLRPGSDSRPCRPS